MSALNQSSYKSLILHLFEKLNVVKGVVKYYLKSMNIQYNTVHNTMCIVQTVQSSTTKYSTVQQSKVQYNKV